MSKSTKKNMNWFLLGILALPIITLGGYYWSTGMISALEDYRSPIKDVSLPRGDRFGDPLTARVVIVLMDALRVDTSMDKTTMPELNRLRSEGASAIMTSKPPSFSAPGWTTLLTGAWPEISDCQPFNPPDNQSVRKFTQDDLFAAADRAGLKTAVSGYAWFEQMLGASGVDAGFYTFEEDHLADIEVVKASLPWLKQDYQLILIHLDQVDYAGHHEGGPIDPRWTQAASRVDALLTSIVSQMDLNNETLVIFSDHGQIDKGGHGGNEPITLMEPFIMTGKGVIPGTYSDLQMVDVAPTLAVLLGTGIPASNQGTPRLDMLSMTPELSSSVMKALSAQQRDLHDAYVTAISQTSVYNDTDPVVVNTQAAINRARSVRLGQERIWRNVLAVFLIFIPGYLLFLGKKKRSLFFIAGAILYLLLFNFIYWVVSKNTYSFSWIHGMNEFIIYMLATSALALLGTWLLTMIILKGFQASLKQATQNTLGLIWAVLYLLSLPILVNFAINGFLPTWTLPEFSIYYYGFLSIVQSMFVASIGLLLMGIYAGISKIYVSIHHVSNKRSR